MKIFLFVVGTLGVGVIGVSESAWSQVAAMREGTFHPTKVSVEVKPLPLALSILPGVASIGAGIELSADSNAATFADAYAINADLATGLRNEGREDDEPVIQKMEGYAGDLGVRYYAKPHGVDSWYGGGKVGYMLITGQWGYKGEKVDQVVRTIAPGIEGGYRWSWNSNMLLRLGAGLDGNIVQENTSGAMGDVTAVTNEAEDKVKEYAQVAVVPKFDVGLGYTF